MVKSKLRTSLSLFLYFFRISWFTFGGGWSIIAQMQKDYVDGKQLLTKEELLDMVSVGKSLPGTMIGNVAYLFGYHLAGVPGGILAVVGMVTPPVFVLSVLTFCYNSFRDNLYVAKALVGIRAAVVPIVGSAVTKLWNGAFPKRICYGICAAGFLLSVLWNINCIFLVLLGGAAGLVLGAWEEKKA